MIAICTRSWQGYSLSLNFQEVLQQVSKVKEVGCEIAVLIIDNSTEGSALEANFDPNVRVQREPRIGIPQARNAALDRAIADGFDWMIFIDDDVSPDEGWLLSMLDSLSEFHVEVVAGQVVYKYPGDYPPHHPRLSDLTYDHGEELVTAATTNVLFRLEPVIKAALRFDETLSEHGGSDTKFFLELRAIQGARIIGIGSAIVLEPIEGNRATLRWHFRRAIRTSQSWFTTVSKLHSSHRNFSNQFRIGRYRRGALVILALFVSLINLGSANVGYRAGILRALMDCAPIAGLILLKLGIRVKEYR